MKTTLYLVPNMEQKILYGLSIEETWLLKKMRGFYDNAIPSEEEILKSKEYQEYFKDKSIKSAMHQVNRKYQDFLRTKNIFQKKFSDSKVLSLQKQIIKIKINDFEEKYYIGNFRKLSKYNESLFLEFVSRWDKFYEMKKIVISPIKSVMFYFQRNLVSDNKDILLENAFDNEELCRFFLKADLHTLNDLFYFDDQQYSLKFYQYFKENKKNKIPLIQWFPVEIVEPFLRHGILTIEDFCNMEDSMLKNLNESYYNQMDYSLKRLQTPSSKLK